MKIVAKPVKMVAFFWPDRTPRPYKFKIPDESGEENTIFVDRVYGIKRTRIAGVESMLFECQSVLDNMQKRYQLKYILKDCRWELYKI